MNTSMNESYLKLKWNIAGTFDEFPMFINQLNDQKKMLPDNNKNDRKKIDNWISQIDTINEEIQTIKLKKIPFLEKKLQYTFNDPDLVVLTFIQPGIRSLFGELSKFYKKAGIDYDFETDLNLDQAAKVLAFIGDAAIDLALAQVLWQPNISNVGKLTKQRSDIASNENLAKVCDKWDLYTSRIPNKVSRTNKEKTNHAKGTIIEALFGVIYAESGLNSVVSSIVVLK
ncbi:ribonuclease III domain-containing protein [Methanolobus sp.]|uniref:ribonuclease III domain-containing protein n=2 Tax=Methanolobus TaxID=2220 RepID=UPI00258DFAF7|nr:ribonuclease III domain-containing protein [Methanolobus sp.]